MAGDIKVIWVRRQANNSEIQKYFCRPCISLIRLDKFADGYDAWRACLQLSRKAPMRIRLNLHNPRCILVNRPSPDACSANFSEMVRELLPLTTGSERRITRWEHEHLLEAVQQRLDANPQAMRQRRETVEHLFGTMKARMGATHFLTKTLPRVAAEMALGTKPLMAAIVA
jgi:hypothetical protein